MSQAAKDGRLKLIGLVVGVVLVFGYIVRTLLSQGSGEPVPEPVAVQPSVGATSVATKFAPDAPAEPAVIVVPRFPASVNANPFRTFASGGTPPRPSGSRSQPPSMLPWPSGDGEMPLLPMASEGAVTMVLKGVIAGQRPVAIIQVGDKAYIVKRGEPVGADLVVERIGRYEVSLKHTQSGKSLTLKF